MKNVLKNIGLVFLGFLLGIGGSSAINTTSEIDTVEAVVEEEDAPAAKQTVEPETVKETTPPAKKENEKPPFDFDTLAMKCDALDQIEYVAKVRNQSGENFDSVGFKATFINSDTGEFIGTADAMVSSFPNGAQRTVDFISFDDCVTANVDIEFQVEYAY